jgi:hypothetical protein
VLGLVADAFDVATDDRPPLPHRLRDREPETFPQRLLQDQGGTREGREQWIIGSVTMMRSPERAQMLSYMAGPSGSSAALLPASTSVAGVCNRGQAESVERQAGRFAKWKDPHIVLSHMPAQGNAPRGLRETYAMVRL